MIFSTAIPTAAPLFSRSNNSMENKAIVNEWAGSEHSTLVDSKPEQLISLLIDEFDLQFRGLLRLHAQGF